MAGVAHHRSCRTCEAAALPLERRDLVAGGLGRCAHCVDLLVDQSDKVLLARFKRLRQLSAHLEITATERSHGRGIVGTPAELTTIRAVLAHDVDPRLALPRRELAVLLEARSRRARTRCARRCAPRSSSIWWSTGRRRVTSTRRSRSSASRPTRPGCLFVPGCASGGRRWRRTNCSPSSASRRSVAVVKLQPTRWLVSVPPASASSNASGHATTRCSSPGWTTGGRTISSVLHSRRGPPPIARWHCLGVARSQRAVGASGSSRAAQSRCSPGNCALLGGRAPGATTSGCSASSSHLAKRRSRSSSRSGTRTPYYGDGPLREPLAALQAA